ncbi:hypothetical protein N9X87_00435 [bacterium]|nr:hypothetical protein [bacterium]
MKAATFPELRAEKDVPHEDCDARPSIEKVRLTAHAELIRERLENRLEKLAELSPESLDITAAVLAVLHDRLNGKSRDLSADHTTDYTSMQLRGDRALSLTRLAFMATKEPDDVFAALQEFVAPFGGQILRVPQDVQDVHLETADLARAVGSFNHLYATAMSPTSPGGHEFTDLERYSLVQALQKVITEASDAATAARKS